MSDSKQRGVLCQQVDEAMADLLEGQGSEELREHLAECDRCRDARHDAERVAALLGEAGADFVMPAEVEQGLGRAIEGAPQAAAEAAAPAGKTEVAPSVEAWVPVAEGPS